MRKKGKKEGRNKEQEEQRVIRSNLDERKEQNEEEKRKQNDGRKEKLNE